MAPNDSVLNSPGAQAENHYVILVHGTWNAPVEGERHWTVLGPGQGSNLASKLNDGLEQRGLSRAVGRRANDVDTSFKWSGENNHAARIEAGRSLFALIKDIETQDPRARIHIVAHSHGGNVVLEAIERYLYQLKVRGYDFERALAKEVAIQHKDPLDLIVGVWWKAGLPLDGLPLAHNELTAIAKLPSRAPQDAANRNSKWQATPKWFRASEIWVAGGGTNRIGKVVFLGTPFFSKRWDSSTHWLRSFIDVPVYGLAAGGLMYLAGELVWATLWVLFGWTLGWFSAPALNPLTWRGWILGGIATVSLAMSFWLALWSRGRDSDHYFNERALFKLDPDRLAHHEFPRAVPIRALVVNAGFADEVLMALSAEQIIYGVMVPQVRKFLSPPLFDTGRASGDLFRPSQFLSHFLSASALRLSRRLLSPILVRGVLRTIQSLGFGLPAPEFQGASIVATSSMYDPAWIKVSEWNVADLISSESTKIPSSHLDATSSGRPNDVSYLVDSVVRAERIRVSKLWPMVEAHLADIEARYRLLPNWSGEKFREETKSVVLALEEQARELLNTVRLRHSQYYTNDVVIDAIADFIAFGVTPAAPAYGSASDRGAN
jgi:hypothetical protein